MNLPELRNRIDRIDQQLLRLLNDRMSLVADVGRWKQEQGQATFAPEREELLLQSLARSNSGPMTPHALRAIYREILSASRARQQPLRIGIWGHLHSSATLAAHTRFGASETYSTFPSWRTNIKALKQGEIDVAILPYSDFLERLSEPKTLELFPEKLLICGEVLLPARSDRPKRPAQRFFLLTPPFYYQQCHVIHLVVLTLTRAPRSFGALAMAGFSLRQHQVVQQKKRRLRVYCEYAGAPDNETFQRGLSLHLKERLLDLTYLGACPVAPLS